VPYDKRRYGLDWGLGLGYYLFYTPYSGLTKALSNGLLPGWAGARDSFAARLGDATVVGLLVSSQ